MDLAIVWYSMVLCGRDMATVVVFVVCVWLMWCVVWLYGAV